MALTIQTVPVPLRTDEYGVVRVGDSQVLLDVVIREFNKGASPAEIAHAYSTRALADGYAVIAYASGSRCARPGGCRGGRPVPATCIPRCGGV